VLSLLLKEESVASTNSSASEDPNSPWHSPSTRRFNMDNQRKVKLVKRLKPDDDKKAEMSVNIVHDSVTGSFRFQVGKDLVLARGSLTSQGDVVALINDRSYNATPVRDGGDIHIFVGGLHHTFSLPEVSFGSSGAGAGTGCVAPMAGKIVKVLVKPKQSVKAGASVVIMEAMKMEHVIRAPKDGVVSGVFFKPGDFVDGGKVVVSFE